MSETGFNNALLVTGGAGFIGSNFVQLAILKKKIRTMVIDKLTYAGHRDNLASVQRDSNFEFVQADIGDAGKMLEILKLVRPKYVVNFAAETHVDRSIDSPEAFVNTNILGTFHLLESVRSYLSSGDTMLQQSFRFLHVSTDEVFGSLGKNGRFTETSPYAPNSPYAASKAAGDHLVRSYFTTYGLPALVTNCSNNYGPYQFPEKLIPLIILNALEGKPLPIYGDGKNVRDWIYVEDHCEGIWSVLKRGTPGDTYNIGAEEEHANIEIVNAICGELERLLPAKKNPLLVSKRIPRYDALRTFVKDRPGHDRRYAIDATKMHRRLKWKPRHTFVQGLRKTTAWYAANRTWCETVQKNNYERQRLGLSPTEK